MATEHDFTRFYQKYKKFFVFLGILLAIQVFLAARVILSLHDDIDFINHNNIFKSHKSFVNPHNWFSSKEDASNIIGSMHFKTKKTNNGDTSTSEKIVPTASSSPQTLDFESLSFVPECDITSKEAISAIQRAKTEKCKEQLAKTTCMIQNGTLYPKRLPRFCSNKKTTFKKNLGCFRDDSETRLLHEQFNLLKNSNSPDTCIDLCLKSGFQYAGVEYSVECFCGNLRPSENFILPTNDCNMKCPSNEDLVKVNNQSYSEIVTNVEFTCGGYFALDVYETGIFHELDSPNEVKSLEEISGIEIVKSVRIVFFLTLNGRAYRQVIRLIKALFHQSHFFYIHVDARQDYLYRELQILKEKLPNNVRFMNDNRRATIWGGASLLTVLTLGMSDIVENSKVWNWDWDYVINLSESDFPLKTSKILERFLSHNAGKNFVKSHGKEVQKFIQKQGLDKTFDECEFRMWRLDDRILPSGILIDGGSDWVALHKDFVRYIVTSDDGLVSGLQKVFRQTLLPAESFFHTVLRNSEFCSSFVDNNLKVTNWKRSLGCKCQYRNVVDWCGCSPNDFRIADWNKLLLAESRLIFFGRKFEAVVNQGIVNKLESWLYPQRLSSHQLTIDKYWQSVYHYSDVSPKVDDALLTLGNSLARFSLKIFAGKFLNEDPSATENSFIKDMLESAKVEEISAFFQNDEFQGILIRSQGLFTSESNIRIESWFKLENIVTLENWNKKISKIHSRIQDIRVGTDYDQKEQTFRNFAGAMGPMSEPTLAYNVFNDESFNITFVWINPINSIQAIQNVTVVDGSTANFVKPNLKTPLLSGIWKVVMTTNGHLVAQMKFLIIPLQFYNGDHITPSQSKKMNTKSGTRRGVVYEEDFNRSSQELVSSIDGFVSKFYTVQDFCLEKELSEVTITRWFPEKKEGDFEGNPDSMDVSLCRHSQWSSLFPDPKSTITHIDPETGLLAP